MFITVFTPAYNRGYILHVLYESLLKQSFTDFEWVIIDDGSTDDTISIVQKFKEDNKIKIVFESKVNEGKHIAINRGAEIASGRLFFTVDSDDYLLPDALQQIYYHWQQVESLPESKKKDIIGIGSNRVYSSGEIIGGDVNYEVVDRNLLQLRFVDKIKGDKAEIYLTNMVKNNPFPKIQGERFCPESLIFYRLAAEGKMLRFVNEKWYVCEYLEDGLTSNSFSTLRRGPIGSLMGYADMLRFKQVPFITKIKYAILFWRFSFHSKNQSFTEKLNMLPYNVYMLFYPLGWMLHRKDNSKNL